MFLQERPGASITNALRHARRYWWRRALADAAFVVAITLATAFAVAWATSSLGGNDGRIASLVGFRTVSIATMVGLAIWLVVTALRSPSLLETARRIDKYLDQSERFSTSFEILATGGPTNVVARALIAEVEDRSGSLAVGRAGWARPRSAQRWAAAAAASIGAIFVVISVFSQIGISTGTPIVGATDGGEVSTVDAATLVEVAELLDLVSERANSDYLRALASSFDDLASRIASEELSGAEAATMVDELSQHLRVASQQVGGAFADAVEEAFAAVSEEVVGPPSARSSGEAGTPQAQSETIAMSVPEGGASTARNDGARALEALEALVDRFVQSPESFGVRSDRELDASFLADYFFEGELGARPSAFTPPNEGAAGARVEAPGGGTPQGAAERSTGAPGDAAGQGGADLNSESGAFQGLETQSVESTPLVHNERSEGQYIEMELVPLATSGTDSTALAAGGVPAFVRDEEAAFGFRGISASHAVAVSRYFTPGMVTSAAGR